MYYGHASWIGLVFFGSLLAWRMLSSQRRRGAPRGPRAGSGFTSDDRHAATRGGPPAPQPGGVPQHAGTTAAGTPPGWFTDPFIRHQQRFWSGSAWTEHVTDDGVPGLDPPPDPGVRDAG